MRLLRLTSVSFTEVSFVTDVDGYERPVTVQVGSGRSWRSAVRFPNWQSSAGESLGDDGLDQEVRDRASEELVRHSAAVDAARGSRAA